MNSVVRLANKRYNALCEMIKESEEYGMTNIIDKLVAIVEVDGKPFKNLKELLRRNGSVAAEFNPGEVFELIKGNKEVVSMFVQCANEVISLKELGE